MDLQGPFIINDQVFTKKELLNFARSCLESGDTENWQSELFRFIITFFDDTRQIIQKSSGTSGKPKIFKLLKTSMVRSSMATLEYFCLKPGNKALLCLPVKYIAGKMMVVRALSGRLNLITVKPAVRPLEHLTSRVDFSAMVPLQIFESIKNRDPLHLVDKLIIGGGEINQRLQQNIFELNETEVYETFGMSETCAHFAVRRINGKEPDKYFKVFEGVKIEADESGCMKVEIPGITAGSITTNDMVRLKGTNSFEWLGRIDNIINSGGIKIVPEKLEKRIRTILNTEAELLVAGLPDPGLGEKAVLVVESDLSDLPFDEWMIKLGGKLTKHEVPKAIYAIPAFPRNEGMKVLRKKVIDFLDVASITQT